MKEAPVDIDKRPPFVDDRALLSEILSLHPDHLTSDELVIRMADGPSETGRVAILDSLQSLKRSGLVRINGEVVEPTYAALRAAEILLDP